jgi:hypothetical protein
MSSPTKDAEITFTFIMNHLNSLKASDAAELNPGIKTALMNMSFGLKSMSVGLRAIYMLLEEVHKELRQLNQSRRL